MSYRWSGFGRIGTVSKLVQYIRTVVVEVLCCAVH